MATYNELPVFKATYDLLLEMFRFTKDFSKEYKYTVGESLKKEKFNNHPFTVQHIWQTHKADTQAKFAKRAGLSFRTDRQDNEGRILGATDT